MALAAACSTADTRSYKGLRVSDEEVPRLGEVVFAEAQCPVSKRPTEDHLTKDSTGKLVSPKAAIPAAAAPAVVGLAVDVAANAVEEALKAAAERLSGYFLATGSFAAVPKKAPPKKAPPKKAESNEAPPKEAESKAAQYYCVIVARGLIGPARVSEKSGDMTKGHLIDLSLADYPAFYLELEAKIEAIERKVRDESGGEVDGKESVMTLTPVYLRYAQSIAVDAGSKKKNVTMALALGRKQPAGKDKLEEGAAAVFRINFGRLDVGSEYGETHLKHLAAAQTVDQNAGPSVAALVTDSEEPSIALKALTSAFASNKADLAKAFKDAFAGDGN